MEQIIVKIAKDATITVEVKGVKGQSCTSVTKAIERITSGAVETTKTGEYYQAQATIGSRIGQGG